MSFISYAQNYEDVMLWRALSHVEKGTYIDVGANDPEIDSVTKAFYDKGWRGINIEPVAHWFHRLEQHRSEDINLQLAIGDKQQEVTFFEVVNTGLSTSSAEIAKRHADTQQFEIQEYQVSSQTLTQVCQEHDFREVHFLKIDVEGGEASVLKGIDFSIIRPWLIVIEATLPNTQIEDHLDWEHLILSGGYHFVYFDGLNRFYADNNHAELDAAFQTPPNYWDHFSTANEVRLTSQNQQLIEVNQQLIEQNQQLTDQNQELLHQKQCLLIQQHEFSEQVSTLESNVNKLDLHITHLNQHIEKLNEKIEEKIEELESSMQDFENLKQDLEHWRLKAEGSSRELQLVYTSRAWRITWPLRKISSALRISNEWLKLGAKGKIIKNN